MTGILPYEPPVGARRCGEAEQVVGIPRALQLAEPVVLGASAEGGELARLRDVAAIALT
jgi:hypothetical protein